MNQSKTTVKVNVSAWQAVLRLLRWAANHFDPNDAHFYAGMLMVFCGLWLVASLGMALLVCGSVVAAVGFLSALINLLLPVWVSSCGGKR